MSGLFGDKKVSPGAFDPRGTAARKMAVESLRNIANTEVRDATPSADEDRDVDAIAELLKGVDSPVAVAELAERLKWDSDRAATALARGGDRGRLTFVRSGGRTFVGLPAASAA
jgi:hypothetical protein